MEEMTRQFLIRGGIHPRGRPNGKSQVRAECLIEGTDPTVEVTARLLQTVERQVLDPTGEPVESMTVCGKDYASRQETVEHEVRIPALPNRTATVKRAGSKLAELVEKGAPAGFLMWRWEPVHCTVEAWIDEIEPGLRRVRVDLANRLEWDGESRERTALRTLHSAHLVLHSPDGAFVSLADPPPALRRQAAACHNDGLWPVPVGAAGDRRTMLAAPLRLDDYPDFGPAERGNPFVFESGADRIAPTPMHHAA
jgi:hypothetical protein